MNTQQRKRRTHSINSTKALTFAVIAALLLGLLVCLAAGAGSNATPTEGTGAGATPISSAKPDTKPIETSTPIVDTFMDENEIGIEENTMISRLAQSENNYHFPSPVENWGALDLEGFVEYDIGEFEKYGGAFPLCLQAYTYAKCREYGVDYAMIVAMIQCESSYKHYAVSYDGKCIGLMQINEYYHSERMEKVGAANLYNPYDNIATGIDFVAELMERYDGNHLKALAAYNMGATGAYRNLWQYGVYEYSYTEKVDAATKEIQKAIGGIEQ